MFEPSPLGSTGRVSADDFRTSVGVELGNLSTSGSHIVEFF